ncbi:hypothetical protein RDV89_15915 [Nocardioides zeae]|uniref:Uncharacterized protein n=1 Tax=Nocardioides imazamoxiresistens TaxID=3231893 RepID=A0ABU3PZG6_9ACTN|nr:hypothetical protein [Nocardioides zeae]MDT9594571.1 hypothetical protein [Nocardioides zeae]
MPARSSVPDPAVPPGTTAADLRRAVLDLLEGSSARRRFAPRLHVGVPGTSRAVDADLPPGLRDDALRADLLTGLLEAHLRSPAAARPPLVWLTRPSADEVLEVDLAWQRATRCVTGETGAVAPFVVVTREGWWCPATASGRTWRRLRDRRDGRNGRHDPRPARPPAPAA